MCRATLSLSLTSMSVITLHRCKSVREDILKQQNHLVDPEVTARSFHAPSSFCILLFLFPSLIWPWSLSMKAVLLQPYPHSRGLIFSPGQNPPQRKSLKILFFFFSGIYSNLKYCHAQEICILTGTKCLGLRNETLTV